MYTELNRIIPTTIVYIAHRYNVEHFALFFIYNYILPLSIFCNNIHANYHHCLSLY